MFHGKKYVVWGGAVVLLLVVCLFFWLSHDKTNKKGTARDLNILLITLDTTRADHLGVYGYPTAKTPALDQLARAGVLFEQCYANVPLTLPSHCSIFTGRTPLGHRVRDNGTFFLDSSETTLAEKLKEQNPNLNTFAVVASFVLMSKFGLNQGFDLYDDSLKDNELMTNFDSEINAEQVYNKFNRWFNTQDMANRPFMAWVHFYDPHSPYQAPAQFQKSFPDSMSGHYDAELAYVDYYVDKIIKTLKSSGVLEKTLIVITGDHGEAFGEHNEVGHALFCYQQNLHVPLFFYNTRLFPKPLKIASRVSLIDIMPTLLELYGQQVPPSLQGKSFVNLLCGATEKAPRTFYIESMHGQEEMGWAPLTGIIDDHYKYISLPEPELYDLTTDPKEKENLFLKKNPLARSLDQKLQKLVKTLSETQNHTGTQRQLSENDKKHLQSLGYISAFSGKTNTTIDPKQGIILKNQLDTIEKDINAGQLQQAETLLMSIIAGPAERVLPQHFGSLNRIYQKSKRPDLVIENWKKAILAFPKNDNFRISLAATYFEEKQWAEAEKVIDDILLHDQKFTRAYILKANIRELQDRNEEALALLEQARQLEPQNLTLKLALAKVLGKTNRIAEATALCNELSTVTNGPTNWESKSKLAIVLTELQQDETAYPLLKQLVDEGHAKAEDWNYLGILYFRRGDLQNALAAYQQSLALDAQSPQTYNNLATLYLTMFQRSRSVLDHSRALANFNKALAIDPNLASALNGRASALRFANRLREALQDWQHALQVKPSFIDVYFNLAVTYLELNKKKEALLILSQCKERFYTSLPLAAQQRLDRLISQASGS